MSIRSASLLLVPAMFLPVTASDLPLVFDPDDSSIRFTLKATMHTVEGSFRLQSGECRVDPSTGAIRGRVIVNAGSGDTANAKRDKKMHRSVLLSAEHPEIVFEPSSYRGELAPQGRSRLQVAGSLRLQGVDHPLELPLEVEIEGDRLRLTASFSVPYVAWGLKDPSAFVLRVAKAVEISIDLAGRVDRAGLAAESPHER